MSADATDRHFEVMLDGLFRDGKKPKALRSLMLDSFEVRTAPDWTPSFVEDFKAEFGYDPRPWLPVLAGRTVKSTDLDERFSFLLHSEDPRPFLRDLSDLPDLPRPLSIETGRRSLNDLYRDLYGVEGL